ncbi:MAG: hypothetical protein QXO27_04475, partial [Candidatus Aenigmatarchaeota archaeon]
MVFGCPKCKSTNIVVAGMTYLCKNCGNTFSINEAIEVKGFLGFLGKLFSKKEKPKDDKGKGKDEKPEEGKKPGESEKPKEKKSIIGTLLKVGGIFALIIAVVVGGIFGYKAIPESAKAGVGKYLKTLSCIFSGDYQQCMISEQTPEAEKIGGYQAVSIQFGSKYNNYQVPMIYARDDSGYYLPITVSNPNPEEDKELTVENFYIKSSFWSNDPGVSEYEKDADMVGGSNLKIMCGIADICTENNNADCQKLPPGIDKEILIRFIDYSKDKENGDCSSASDFKIRLSDSECQETCTINKNEDGKSKIEAVKACSDNSTCANSLCEDKCKDPEYNFLDFVNYTYDASTKKCICERNRNNFNELCSEKFGQSATIKFLA